VGVPDLGLWHPLAPGDVSKTSRNNLNWNSSRADLQREGQGRPVNRFWCCSAATIVTGDEAHYVGR